MKIPAWRLLVAALIAGVDGDLLLRSGSQWRAGFAIWIAGIVASAFVLDRHASRERRLMLAGVAAAAFGLVMRDADLLYGIDFASMLVMGALVIWHGGGRSLADLSLVEATRAGILSAINTVGGAAGVLRRTAAERSGTTDGNGRTRAILVGVVLAVPPLAVVTALLSSSDKVFQAVIDQIGGVFAVNSFNHLFVIALLAWFSAGWLRASTGDTLGGDVPAPASPGLRFATIAVPVYSLVALLSLFLVTQARVLFGGAQFLKDAEGLTVANYAREGFFQLILAAFIVLATLVMAEWLMAKDDVDARRHFRIAGGALLALVTTLLVSAAARIGIYVGMFGHSVDRTFACAAIVWVLLALVTCAMTTLRNRPARFAPATMGVTIGWVVALNLLNPEAMVVRANFARAAAGAPFDVTYHATLSADAVPALLAGASRLQQADCDLLATKLRETWQGRGEQEDGSWRDWRGGSIPLSRVSRWYFAAAVQPCGAVAP